MCSAFRSTSFDAITLIALTVPYALMAAERERMYGRIAEVKGRGEIPDTGEIGAEERLETRQ